MPETLNTRMARLRIAMRKLKQAQARGAATCHEALTREQEALERGRRLDERIDNLLREIRRMPLPGN